MRDITHQNGPSRWLQAWKLLETAANTGGEAFSTPCISTVAASDTSRPRVVVLRECSSADATLTFYTDARSIKVDHLRNGSAVSWCFWDPEAQLQFIGGGQTSEAVSATRREIWDGLPKHSRKAYATRHPPGTILAERGTDLPPDWESRDLAQTEYAFDHFAVLTTRLEWAEVLHLDRGGNTRIAATRSPEGGWTFNCLVP